MIRLTAGETAKITGGQLVSGKKESVIGGFSIDSRRIEPGRFFIAIKGRNFDGHDFIGEVIKKGASGVIVEQAVAGEWRNKTGHVIAVEDTRVALGRIAAEIRKRTDIPVICVTGTNGKTTVKDILSDILAARYKVLKSRKSYNNIIGLSLTLFDLDPTYDIAVLELGTSCPGEIAGLAQIAMPQAVIITNIGDAHLKGFVAREKVFLEKTSVLDYLPPEGIAFLNGDDPLLAGVIFRRVPVKFYGFSAGCDFRISGLLRKAEGYEFSLDKDCFFLPLEGMHNVYNAVSAVAAARHFGVSCGDIRQVLANVSLPEMRLEKITAGGFLFINDAYNANPGSFMCALDVLEHSTAGTVKGVVAGNMMDLGDASAEFHKIIGRSVARRKFDFLIVLGDKAEGIALGALEAGMKEQQVFRAENHQNAAEIIRFEASPETVVLLKGSRAARMEEVLKCFTTFCTR